MILAKELRAALTDILKNKAGFPHEVHFDNNIEASKSYFYVELSENRKTVDPVYYERSIGVDIQLVLLPDEFNRIRRADLYDARDRLDQIVRPVVQIGDRFIAVSGTRGNVFNSILHYEFKLEFVDFLPTSEYDLAETLDLSLSTKRQNFNKEE